MRREAGAAGLDLEADAFERFLQELRALEILHAELAEVIERIADQRELRRIALDGVERELLALVGLGVARDGKKQQRCKKGPHAVQSTRPLSASMRCM